ncbi:AMP-binding protein [Caldalkalibacillus salinus]|uniref:AMP-binding protein n=1 Tax=Caldalkalibacillus salinus TaxID=2803787 RepID=UPI001921B25E|nr:AMP-binding protein [Caldalkalibacillus salinus]
MSQKQLRWHEHYPHDIPTTLDYPEVCLQDLLEEAYHKKPNRIAIRFLGKGITFRQLYHEAHAFAASLRALGVSEGDRVSIMLPNCPQAVISYYGVLLAGGIVVQTNPLYVERELKYQLQDSGAKTIIGLDLVYPRIAKVQADCELKNIIITSIKDYLPFPKNVLYPLVQRKQGLKVDIAFKGNVRPFLSLIKRHNKPSDIKASRTPDDIAVLQYTGGTTGHPKGVMLTHRNLVVNTYQCCKWLSTSKYGTERTMGVVPFFHVYGMTVVMNFSVMLAATMILVPKFESKEVLKTIHKEKPTLFPGAPTIYIGLLNDPHVSDYDLSSIKACISGSAPLPVEIQQRFEKVTGGKLVEGYGLTETSPVTHANLIQGDNVVGSIGIPWPDTEATILPLDSQHQVDKRNQVERQNQEHTESNATHLHPDALPAGEIGEIAIRGPQVMKGYWKRPDETKDVMIEDGWFLTGDVGYMDERGYFYIVDRKKDMIIAGGFNIYPRDIEEVLYEHPAVVECVVIGVPDDYRGETVKAFIVKKDNVEVTEEELNQFCRKKLASYKAPRIYEFRDELPKSMVGKILRRALREEENKRVSND